MHPASSPGEGLPLLFPRHDLGFVYDSAALRDDDGAGEDAEEEGDGARGDAIERLATVRCGARAPHCRLEVSIASTDGGARLRLASLHHY